MKNATRILKNSKIQENIYFMASREHDTLVIIIATEN